MSEKQIENSTKQSVSPLNSRRNLVKGVVAAPLLMTIASRPVLAKGICTPSAWVSGNLSDTSRLRECGGYSPGYWKKKTDQWPAPYQTGTCKPGGYSGNNGTCTDYNSDGTKFHDVFNGTQYGSDTLMQVLWRTGNQDYNRLGFHIVAALLNAASISDYGMTTTQVIDMYNQLQSTGMYTTSAGDLTIDQVVEYIKQTYSY